MTSCRDGQPTGRRASPLAPDDALFADLAALLPRLRRFARSLTREEAFADDLVQTALERVLRLRCRYRSGTRVDSLLCKIIHNAWRDELRRRRRHGDEEPAVSMPTCDGERAAFNRVLLREVEGAIARLPGPQRQTLRLVGLAGCSYAEAASLMGTSLGTVMSRCARARERLATLTGHAEAA